MHMNLALSPNLENGTVQSNAMHTIKSHCCHAVFTINASAHCMLTMTCNKQQTGDGGRLSPVLVALTCTDIQAGLMGLLQLRFEHDTTSYEELCAFEQ